MAKIFITGSSDGLGLLAAKALIADGHRVVLHAKNEKRKEETIQKVQGAETVLTADLSNIQETKALAAAVNNLGDFDAVIHNAGVYGNAPAQQIFAVNVLAPYMLTALINKPKRLIYISSDMHLQGETKFDELKSDIEKLNYSDSKLLVLMLCKAVARKWEDVCSNAVNPGWVPTKMGGSNAPDDLQKGYETQLWLAISDDEQAKTSGGYYFHQKVSPYHSDAGNVALQENFLEWCREITGVSFD
ncbi:SDR family NAD(P)-dependent oxidoreductase [Chryseobacterium sp. SIMBA_029]|uniref:SDR family NAD(P)-dependent oxidoreductase n=1 Tax=Chryseobacterium sp. SIMBA_029 TaxID=3085772 RepID=UPI00397D3878